MATVKTLLVPIDFSPSSESGARLAARLAERHKAQVILLHALPPRAEASGDSVEGYEGGESPNEADAYWAERLAEVANRAGCGGSSEQLIVEGEPPEAICREAERRRVDLIVLATRGFGSFRADLLGSNAAKVLHDARIPVLTTVHEQGLRSEARACGGVVCSLDLSAPSVDSLRWANAMARDLGVPLYTLYVAPELPIEEQARSDFQSTLLASSRRRMAEVLADVQVEAESLIESGGLGPTVASVVERLGAGLLVLGRRSEGEGRITGHAFEILRSSPCPVVSV